MDYLVLSEDLAVYDLSDVEAGLDRLKYREEYEPAFPDIGLIETAINAVIRLRKSEARRVAEEAAEAARAQHQRDHPEEYVSVRDFWKDVTDRIQGRMAMPDGPAPQSAAPEVQSANTGCAIDADTR